MGGSGGFYYLQLALAINEEDGAPTTPRSGIYSRNNPHHEEIRGRRCSGGEEGGSSGRQKKMQMVILNPSNSSCGKKKNQSRRTGFAGRIEEEEEEEYDGREPAFLLCRFARGGIWFWDLWEGGGRTEGGNTKKKKFIFVDCVVVGGGINGLCIAQVLATKHGDVVPNVIVTEARDRVGGNIIIVEKTTILEQRQRLRLERKDTKLYRGFGEDKQVGVYRIK
ncbi:uncharacterized protein LOC126616074 [Malus sylvestris]|uniref:uncharacterized protein LOC126616074 n=1 Tax=Malus sylvestris TaxID=3752 RepID=UPI0021AD1D16|nr:uncharacterized protein LOC126616074 [Malus sylvestris]